MSKDKINKILDPRNYNDAIEWEDTEKLQEDLEGHQIIKTI